MKRKVTFIFILLIIISLISSCLFSPQNTSKETVFNKQTYQRTEYYNRTFTMQYADTHNYGIGFEENSCSTDEMQIVVNSFNGYVDTIKDKIEEEAYFNFFNVYIINEASIDGIYSFTNNIFCRISDLETEDFKIALIKTCLSISEPWISYGLYSLVFDKSINTNNLFDYYTSSDDISILGLFGAHFYSEFNSDIDTNIARDTAASLTEYVFSKYGYNILLHSVTDEIKQSWLNNIGVNKEFHYDYGDLLDNFCFSKSKEYPIIIVSSDANYNISTNNDQLTSSKDIEEFIYEDIIGRHYILDFLTTNTKQNSNMLNSNIFITYYINDFPYNNSSERGEIELNNISAHLHESVHTMIRPQKVWIFEGLADYLSMVIYQPRSLKEAVYSLFNSINQQYTDGMITDKDSRYLVLDYYTKVGGNFDTIEGIDLIKYCDASAFINLSTPYGGPSEKNSIYEIHNISEHNIIDGDELSYKQACSFISYILSEYSLDTLLEYSKSGSGFEEVFGNSYEEIKSNWIESISIS